MSNITDKLRIALDNLKELDEEYVNIPIKQSEIDSKLSDVYHYIENNKLNTKQCYRAIKLIHELRLERRKIKNEIELLRVYKTNELKLNNLDSREILYSNMKTTEKKLNESIYNNRIYTEEELKEIIGMEE